MGSPGKKKGHAEAHGCLVVAAAAVAAAAAVVVAIVATVALEVLLLVDKS